MSHLVKGHPWVGANLLVECVNRPSGTVAVQRTAAGLPDLRAPGDWSRLKRFGTAAMRCEGIQRRGAVRTASQIGKLFN